MPVTTEQIADFQQFALETIRTSEDDLSFDELVELWMLKTLPDEELQESLQALNEGIADAEAGRVRPADEVFRDLQVRYAVGGGQ